MMLSRVYVRGVANPVLSPGGACAYQPMHPTFAHIEYDDLGLDERNLMHGGKRYGIP